MLYNSESLEKIYIFIEQTSHQAEENGARNFSELVSSVLSFGPHFGLLSHLEAFTSHTG